MANKKRSTFKLLIAIFCFVFLAGVTPLSAQNLSQTLKWNSDPNVLEYKVEVKDKSGTIIKSFITEESSINLTLEEGSYKYKITAYDFLGRESVSTDWVSFEVVIAKQPEIVHKKNLESLEEDGKSLSLDVSVEDIGSEAVAELVNVKNNKRIPGELVLAPKASTAAASTAAELSASETHSATKVLFDDVPEGDWKLVIKNPSGLSSESESFAVKDTHKEERIAAQKAEEERIAREKAEREEQERIAAEKAAAEKAAREEAERIAAEKAAAEKERLEKERLEREEEERVKQELERQRLEEERLAREEEERIEAERIAKEQAEKEEQERLIREEEERLALEEEEHRAREEEEERKLEEKEKKKEKWLTYDRKFTVAAGVGSGTVLYSDEVFTQLVDNPMFNLAVNANIAFMPDYSRTGRFRFGVDVNAMATRLKSTTEFYDLTLNLIAIQGNLVIRFGNKSKKMWLQLKGGAGFALINEKLDYNEISENNGRIDIIHSYGYPTAGGGLSILLTPSPLFMVEIGADFYHLFIPEMNTGILNPYVEIGIRF